MSPFPDTVPHSALHYGIYLDLSQIIHLTNNYWATLWEAKINGWATLQPRGQQLEAGTVL